MNESAVNALREAINSGKIDRATAQDLYELFQEESEETSAQTAFHNLEVTIEDFSN